MPPDETFYVEFDSVSNMVGRFGYKVKNRKREGYNVVAHCENQSDADLVANALNFNASPRKYGYVFAG